jgi:coenzyme F420 hydrogenase subunit beta
MTERPKIFGHLMTEVIRKGTCVSCGACEAVCTVNTVKLENGTPKLVGLCIACQMCYWNCPMTGRTRTEEEAEIGVHKAIYAVRAKENEILGRAQDGGAVTAILYQFLSDGGEGAIVAGVEEEAPWKARPMVVRTKEEVLKGAGTKYTPSPTLVGVASAIQEHDLKKIAVVGTPCQMKALGKIETGARCEAKISEAVKLKIGLFCMETFSYPSFMEYLENEGIDPVKVDKFEIKGGRFIANQDGETVHRVRLSKVKQLVRGCCHSCGDFTAEFSDISAGNVGSPDGWSTVIVRTDVGEKALKAVEKAGLVEIQPVEEGKSGLGLVERLAVKKRKDAEKAGEEK